MVNVVTASTYDTRRRYAVHAFYLKALEKYMTDPPELRTVEVVEAGGVSKRLEDVQFAVGARARKLEPSFAILNAR